MNKIDFKVEKKEKENKNELLLIIEAPSVVSDKAYTLALRDVTNSVDISGFRKGKAPKDMVEGKVGQGYISQKAFESIFYDLLIDVALQEKLDIVDVVQIESFELLPGKPLNFKVSVEVKPEVKLGNYKDLKIKTKKIAYDKEIFLNKTLDKISNNLITFKKIEDRPVKQGDLVTIDFEAKFEDGSEVPGGKAENFQAILEKDKFLPEFVEKLSGVKVGESKELDVTFPEKSGEAFANKIAKFNVTLKAIEEKVLPKIDDELAKQVGLDSLDALKLKVEEQMKSMEDEANQRELENKLVDELVSSSKFDISERMINKEMDYLLQDLRSQCQKGGIEWDSFKKDDANKEIFEKAKDAAGKRVSIDLILGAVIKEEKLLALKEELDKEVQLKAASFGEKYKHLETDPRFRSNVELVILRSKAVDFLLKNNTPEWEKEVTIITPD